MASAKKEETVSIVLTLSEEEAAKLRTILLNRTDWNEESHVESIYDALEAVGTTSYEEDSHRWERVRR